MPIGRQAVCSGAYFSQLIVFVVEKAVQTVHAILTSNAFKNSEAVSSNIIAVFTCRNVLFRDILYHCIFLKLVKHAGSLSSKMYFLYLHLQSMGSPSALIS